MTSIMANNEVLSVFGQVKGPVEVRDAAGNLVGFFAPVPPERAHHYAQLFPSEKPNPEQADPLARLRTDFDLEEAKRQLALTGKGRTLVEIYEDLLAITPEPYWRDHLQEQINLLKERDRCDSQ